mmetsp:Transcript_16999/g.33217  ORF Transcript_16999/g.33217 Transcript_16999/m.33217 type:complete len:338 (+) Transcript_16999:111-1124(+)
MVFEVLAVLGGLACLYLVSLLAARIAHRSHLEELKQTDLPHIKRRQFAFGKTCGHRGERETAPENTIPAFERAAAVLDSLEFDVWLTKDRKVVVLHDGSLQRMCGVDGHVHDFDYADLPKVHRVPSEGFPQGKDHPGESEDIPLLEEVLDLFAEPGCTTKFLIEFKIYSPLLAHSVHDILQKRELIDQNRVVWFSLHRATNKLLRQVDEHVPRVPSVLDAILCVFAYHCGLLSLVPFDFDIFAMPCETPEGLLDFVNRVPIVRSLREDWQLVITTIFFNMKTDLGLFRAMKERGYQNWLLGVNDDDSYAFAQQVHPDCIFTDRPLWFTEKIKLSPLF